MTSVPVLGEDGHSCRANAAKLCSLYVLFVKPVPPAPPRPRILRFRPQGERNARWPVSRVLSPLPGDGHSSRTPVARRLAAAYPDGGPKTDLPAEAGAPPLFGLAPGGVCRAVAVAGGAVRSYRTLSPLPADRRAACGRSALCGTFPRVAPAGRYPAPCLRGARTFLSPRRDAGSGHPAIWHHQLWASRDPRSSAASVGSLARALPRGSAGDLSAAPPPLVPRAFSISPLCCDDGHPCAPTRARRPAPDHDLHVAIERIEEAQQPIDRETT